MSNWSNSNISVFKLENTFCLISYAKEPFCSAKGVKRKNPITDFYARLEVKYYKKKRQQNNYFKNTPHC